mgnify:CR=1 FL=1|tara:strand:- start:1907 stop:2137 length:231 start_codon:yes stop_codon:yes gene_type:complete
MKILDNGEKCFDEKVFKVEVTGREVAHIYAALMNLDCNDFNRSIGYTSYCGEHMFDTDEIDAESWYELIQKGNNGV